MTNPGLARPIRRKSGDEPSPRELLSRIDEQLASLDTLIDEVEPRREPSRRRSA